MVKILIVLFSILFALSIYIAKPILAGGGQVRGENGQGSIVQICITVDGDYTCMWNN